MGLSAYKYYIYSAFCHQQKVYIKNKDKKERDEKK